MNKTRAQLPTTFFRAILATAAAIWGLGFVIGKGAIAEIGATWFTAIRFIGSGFVLLIILFPHFKCHLNRSLVKAGCIIGVFSFLGFLDAVPGARNDHSLEERIPKRLLLPYRASNLVGGSA